MESGYRTPLLDFFRRGEVAPDIRMLAAQGALAPRPHEQLGLLVLLLDDPDPTIRAVADDTINRIPLAALSGFLARSDISPEIRDVFTKRGVAPASVPSNEQDEPLIATDDDELTEIDTESSPSSETEVPPADAPPDEADLPPERQATVQRLAMMKITQRIKTAMRGTREERAVLIRDPNKLVALAVLSCPKVTDSEVESYARMTSVSEEVLRVIGTTRAWVKNYGVMASLARNPKTPLAVSMGLIKHLNERDLRNLVSDRNVPDLLRLGARKLIANNESRRQ